jgi:hypothetical protein
VSLCDSPAVLLFTDNINTTLLSVFFARANHLLKLMTLLIDSEYEQRHRAYGGGEMVDQGRVGDLKVLAALLADVERELASGSEDDKGKIRELRQHCILLLALLDKAKVKEPN